jgi:hypothetical protein
MTGTPHAHLVMQPVWATLGDYDNLLGLRKIIHTGSQEAAALYSHPFDPFSQSYRYSASIPGPALSAEHEAAISTPGNLIKWSKYDDFKLAKDNSGVFCVPHGGSNEEGIVWTGLRFAPAKIIKQSEAAGAEQVVKEAKLGVFAMSDVLGLLMPKSRPKSCPTPSSCPAARTAPAKVASSTSTPAAARASVPPRPPKHRTS